MARLLLVYGTTEGHTATLAERIATVTRGEGIAVELHDSRETRKQALAAGFDGVILAGSVHAGDHQSSLREFAKRNRDLLDRTPSAFLSVSLAAADPDAEAAAEAQAMVDKFIRETGWQPQRIERVAGALVFTQYNFFIRHLMKLIAKSHGRTELDTSRDYDFTDWAAVDQFAHEFAATVRQHAEEAAGAPAMTATGVAAR